MTFLQSWKESLLIFAPQNLKKFLSDFVTIFVGTCKRLLMCWFWLIIGMGIAAYFDYSFDVPATRTISIARIIFVLLLFIFTAAAYLSTYQSFAKKAFVTIKQALPVFGKFLIAQILLSIVFVILLAFIVNPFLYYFTTGSGEAFFTNYKQAIEFTLTGISVLFKGTAVIIPFFAFYFYDSDRTLSSWWSCLIKALKTTFMYYPACWILRMICLLPEQILLGLSINIIYLQLAAIISIPISTALAAALYKRITKQ